MTGTECLLASLALAILTALALHLGMRVGRRVSPGSGGGAGGVLSAMVSLLVLLLALTVVSAATRFDARRRLIVDEANAIGTAYLRVELLPEESQPPLQRQFADYLDSRIATFRKLPDLAGAKAELARSERMQREIWSTALAACARNPGYTPAPILFLPALNQMIDLASTRTMVSQMHLPAEIFFAMALVLLGCAFYSGFAMAGTRAAWIPLIGFLLLHVLVFGLILDLEFPRAGLVREQAFDQALMDLRRTLP